MGEIWDENEMKVKEEAIYREWGRRLITSFEGIGKEERYIGYGFQGWVSTSSMRVSVNDESDIHEWMMEEEEFWKKLFFRYLTIFRIRYKLNTSIQSLI